MSYDRIGTVSINLYIIHLIKWLTVVGKPRVPTNK